MSIKLDNENLKVIRLDNGEIIFSKIVVNDKIDQFSLENKDILVFTMNIYLENTEEPNLIQLVRIEDRVKLNQYNKFFNTE